MRGDREFFLQNCDIIGLVTFMNSLKEDAQETVSALTAAEINTKIITGDNIFLGVQTALEVGMISSNTRIIVL